MHFLLNEDDFHFGGFWELTQVFFFSVFDKTSEASTVNHRNQTWNHEILQGLTSLEPFLWTFQGCKRDVKFGYIKKVNLEAAWRFPGCLATWRIIPVSKWLSRWWFQIFYIFIPTWGRFPFWLIFFKGVETTNQLLTPILKAMKRPFRGGMISPT